MSRNQAKRELLSAIIAETLDDEVVTLGALADRAARHGFGLLMIVLSLPTLFPALPPGLAPFVGFLYVVLAAQMLIGLERPWLPARVPALAAGAVSVAGVGAEKLAVLVDWFLGRGQ